MWARWLLTFVGLPVALAYVVGASLWPLLAAFVAYLLLMMWGARSAAAPLRAGKRDWAGGVFILFLFFGLPPALASVTGASWAAIGMAYAIWFGLLGLWIAQGLASRGVSSGEAVGWPFLAGMFLTMGAVPVLALVITLTKLA